MTVYVYSAELFKFGPLMVRKFFAVRWVWCPTIARKVRVRVGMAARCRSSKIQFSGLGHRQRPIQFIGVGIGSIGSKMPCPSIGCVIGCDLFIDSRGLRATRN